MLRSKATSSSPVNCCLRANLDGEIQTDGILNLADSAIINGNINAQTVVFTRQN